MLTKLSLIQHKLEAYQVGEEISDQALQLKKDHPELITKRQESAALKAQMLNFTKRFSLHKVAFRALKTWKDIYNLDCCIYGNPSEEVAQDLAH